MLKMGIKIENELYFTPITIDEIEKQKVFESTNDKLNKIYFIYKENNQVKIGTFSKAYASAGYSNFPKTDNAKGAFFYGNTVLLDNLDIITDRPVYSTSISFDREIEYAENIGKKKVNLGQLINEEWCIDKERKLDLIDILHPVKENQSNYKK